MRKTFVASLLLVVGILSCSSPTEPTAVASVTINPSTSTIASGATASMTATTLDAKGRVLEGRIVSWTSSDALIATVNANGEVNAGQNRSGAPATVTITATSEGKTGAAVIRVTPVPVAKVIIAPDSLLIDPGLSAPLSITVQDASGAALSGRTTAWTSQDTTVAKVNASGQVTAAFYSGPERRATQIIATVEGKGDTIPIIVSALAVARVQLNVDSTTLVTGQTLQLNATIKDSAGVTLTGRTIVWTVNDTTVLQTSQSGNIEATRYFGGNNRRGSVIATVSGKADTANIIITPVPVAQVSVVSPSASIAVGGRLQLTTVLTDAAGNVLSGRQTDWQSSDTTKIRVTQTGLTIGYGVGQAVISARSEGRTGETNLSAKLFSGVKTLASSQSATCGLQVDGTAVCWGDGPTGNAIQGTLAETPIAVPGNISFVSLAAGLKHICGLAAGGAVYCWGSNQYGQLGNGGNLGAGALETNPVAVSTIERFVSLSAGGATTCALTDSLKAFCWGAIGDGSTSTVPTPILSAPPFKLMAISRTGNEICGLSVDGYPFCWGRFYLGADRNTFKKLTDEIQLSTLSVGDYHACGIDNLSKAYCWGLNQFGELGHSTFCEAENYTFRLSNCQLASNIKYKDIHAAKYYTCAVDETQLTYCWGLNNQGQLGTNDIGSRNSPTRVATGERFSSLSLGDMHTCGITTNLTARCWGDDNAGQLGNGAIQNTVRPIPIQGSYIFRNVQASNNGSCGQTSDESYVCWGNTGSQLDFGSTPTPEQFTTSYTTIARGDAHRCALDASGKAFCWGDNSQGQLGVPKRVGGSGISFSREPIAVSTELLFKAITVSQQSTCAVSNVGRVYCWGFNTWGTLGNTSTVSTSIPTPIASNEQFSSVAGGANHMCGITTAGVAYCWGTNGNGQLGNGTTSQSNSTPVRVRGDLSFATITAGGGRTCGITSATKNIYCWGRNDLGQLGDGTTTQRLEPTRVSLDAAFTDISIRMGGNFTCAIASTKNAYCWGENAAGQLGDGTIEPKLNPTPVQTSMTFASIANGAKHACAISTEGRGYCWGAPNAGQLGDGTIARVLSPTEVNGGFQFRAP